MKSNARKPITTESGRQPFICHLMPSVYYVTANINPFVVENIPLVENEFARRGFTLIELMVTLSIVVILGLLAVPTMTTFIKNQRISGQANDLLADLQFARVEAIKRAATVTICKQNSASATPNCSTTISDPWTTGWVVFVDSDGDGQIDTAPAPGEEVLRIRAALEGGNFVTSATTSTSTAGSENAAIRIRFLRNGGTTIDFVTDASGQTTQRARLRLCDDRGPGSSLTVEVAPMGRARVNSTRPPTPNTCPTTSNW